MTVRSSAKLSWRKFATEGDDGGAVLCSRCEGAIQSCWGPSDDTCGRSDD